MTVTQTRQRVTSPSRLILCQLAWLKEAQTTSITRGGRGSEGVPGGAGLLINRLSTAHPTHAGGHHSTQEGRDGAEAPTQLSRPRSLACLALGTSEADWDLPPLLSWLPAVGWDWSHTPPPWASSGRQQVVGLLGLHPHMGRFLS